MTSDPAGAITTDRQSAFDRVLASIPFKGQVLNETGAWWFEQTRDIIPNRHGATRPERDDCQEMQTLPNRVRGPGIRHRKLQYFPSGPYTTGATANIAALPSPTG